MKSMLAAGLAFGLSSLFATGALACSGGDCLYTPASAGYAFAAPPAPPPEVYYAPQPQFRGWPPGYAVGRPLPPGYATGAYGYGSPQGDYGQGYDQQEEYGRYGEAQYGYGEYGDGQSSYGQGYAPPPIPLSGLQANPNYPCLSCAPPPVYVPRPCPQAERPQPYVCLAPGPETVSLRGDLFTGGVGDTGGAYGGGGGWGGYYGSANNGYSGAAGARLNSFVASRTTASGGARVSVSASAYASARASAGGRSYGGGGKRGGKH